jgi:hypothetical protein
MLDDRCDVLCLDVPLAEELRRRRVTIEAAERAAGRARALGDPTRLGLATSCGTGESSVSAISPGSAAARRTSSPTISGR